MERTTLLDPFLGIPFDVLQFDDGTFAYVHPVSGKTYHGKQSGNYICIDARAFLENETVTAVEAAEHLHVSKQYVNQLCKTGALKSCKVGNNVYVDVASLQDNLF